MPGAPNAPGIVPSINPYIVNRDTRTMATPRKPLPTAARLAVREALEAAQTAAALIRQARRAQTAATPGDIWLADALTELERIRRLLGEALRGGTT